MSAWLSGIETSGAEYCLLLISASALYFSSLEKREHWLFRLLGGSLVLAALGLIFPNNFPFSATSLPIVMLWYTAAFALTAVLAWLCCRISLKEAFACAIFGVFTEHLSSSVYILVSALQGKVFHLQYQQALIYIAIYLLIWLFIARKMPDKNGHYSISLSNILITSVFGNFVTVVLSIIVKMNVDPEQTYSIMDSHTGQLFYAGQLYAIGFCMTMLIIQYATQRQIAAHKELAATNTLWQLRQKQYEMTKENIDLINRKCHDMKHQVAALMAQNPGDRNRERYVREIQDMVQIYENSADTGNEVLNTLLTEKGLFCSMNNIQWVCAVDARGMEFMDVLDMYTMIGNALDNAVEAVMKIGETKKRIIQMSGCRRGQLIEFRVENSFEGQISFRDGLPETSKEDKFSHE